MVGGGGSVGLVNRKDGENITHIKVYECCVRVCWAGEGGSILCTGMMVRTSLPQKCMSVASEYAGLGREGRSCAQA